MSIGTGAVALRGDIKNEFLGPDNLRAYLRGAGYTTNNNTNVPTSGALSMLSFRGATRGTPVTTYPYISGSTLAFGGSPSGSRSFGSPSYQADWTSDAWYPNIDGNVVGFQLKLSLSGYESVDGDVGVYVHKDGSSVGTIIGLYTQDSWSYSDTSNLTCSFSISSSSYIQLRIYWHANEIGSNFQVQCPAYCFFSMLYV